MYVARQFQTPGELLDYLNDAVIGGVLSGPLNLDTLTLILGATTVTFVGTALTPNQIVAQINAAVAGAAELRNYGRQPPYGVQVAIVKAGTVVQLAGTANALLGFSTAVARTVGASAVAKVNIVDIEIDMQGRVFHVIHE